MESLTPFIRHALGDAPGPSGPPEATSSRVSPALGTQPGQPPVTEPPGQTDNPDVQLPPPEVPRPKPSSRIPMTDGTPAACRQKNAAEFLAGHSPGVMTQYGGGLFGAEMHLYSRHPAPDEDASGVLQLVEWREEAPYG